MTDEIHCNIRNRDVKISRNTFARYEAPPRNGLAEALPSLMHNAHFKQAEPRMFRLMLAGFNQLKNHPSNDYILFPPI